MVTIIDVSSLKQKLKDSEFDEEKYEESIQQNNKANHGKLEMEQRRDSSGNWESGDSDENESMSDDDSDSDEGKGKKQGKKDKKLNPKNATLSMSKKMAEDAHRKDFFDDL